MNNARPFHLAIPVLDLERSRLFYTELLGCKIGRSSSSWIDLNLFGHQLVIHQSDQAIKTIINAVDSQQVPVPHFGVILEWNEWHKFSKKISKKIKFEIEPYIRFKNQVGEQATMFFMDPDNNALEFKAFKNDDNIFKS